MFEYQSPQLAGEIISRAIERALKEAQSEMRSLVLPHTTKISISETPLKQAWTVNVAVDIEPRFV